MSLDDSSQRAQEEIRDAVIAVLQATFGLEANAVAIRQYEVAQGDAKAFWHEVAMAFPPT